MLRTQAKSLAVITARRISAIMLRAWSLLLHHQVLKRQKRRKNQRGSHPDHRWDNLMELKDSNQTKDWHQVCTTSNRISAPKRKTSSFRENSTKSRITTQAQEIMIFPDTKKLRSHAHPHRSSRLVQTGKLMGLIRFRTKIVKDKWVEKAQSPGYYQTGRESTFKPENCRSYSIGRRRD